MSTETKVSGIVHDDAGVIVAFSSAAAVQQWAERNGLKPKSAASYGRFLEEFVETGKISEFCLPIIQKYLDPPASMTGKAGKQAAAEKYLPEVKSREELRDWLIANIGNFEGIFEHSTPDSEGDLKLIPGVSPDKKGPQGQDWRGSVGYRKSEKFGSFSLTGKDGQKVSFSVDVSFQVIGSSKLS